MRTAILCLLLICLMSTISNASDTRCKLTIFWERPGVCLSITFPCDWAGTADLPGADGTIIVWGLGKKPMTVTEMFERCSGWRDGTWTRAYLEVVR